MCRLSRCAIPLLLSPLLLFHNDPNNTDFPMLFSSKPSQASPTRSADVARPNRRCSTTISMLEEEFGMREPPKTTTRFALPPKLRILPPKRKNPTTQAPEPRRGSSFSKGPWETLWGCDLEAESPIEADFNLERFPDYHAEQGSEPEEDVATPVNGTSWTSDEELTPLFSSNFPTRSTDSNASTREGYSESCSSRCLNSHRA